MKNPHKYIYYTTQNKILANLVSYMVKTGHNFCQIGVAINTNATVRLVIQIYCYFYCDMIDTLIHKDSYKNSNSIISNISLI